MASTRTHMTSETEKGRLLEDSADSSSVAWRTLRPAEESRIVITICPTGQTVTEATEAPLVVCAVEASWSISGKNRAIY
ncbi:hypothetical protein DTO282F9_8110 [Paecilomyces variotii]|nr:hypothetical protein DTO282E5_8461 [Paecilomyces variotii]KAJ9394968.1 hypothetical protein DTO282F9_8110 [Paecilomyces variotii]